MGRWERPHWAGEKTGRNPTDRGKRGVKRSVLTDGSGIPLSVVIDGANHFFLDLYGEEAADVTAKFLQSDQAMAK